MFIASISSRRWSPVALAVSVTLHAVLIAALLWHPGPRLVQPVLSLRGDGGATMVAFTLPGRSTPFRKAAHEKAKRALTLPRVNKDQQSPYALTAAVAHDQLKPGMPGYILGSLTSGFVADHDVRVAYSVVHPDPPINRAKLPPALMGDVVIEVTIDEKGSVTETQLLQSIGFGLDEILLSTVRGWHYAPARVDGIPVASRHDVHFHFPS